MYVQHVCVTAYLKVDNKGEGSRGCHAKGLVVPLRSAHRHDVQKGDSKEDKENHNGSSNASEKAQHKDFDVEILILLARNVQLWIIERDFFT